MNKEVLYRACWWMGMALDDICENLKLISMESFFFYMKVRKIMIQIENCYLSNLLIENLASSSLRK